MLPVVDGRVAHNVDGQDTRLVGSKDETDDRGLVRRGQHGKGVEAGSEDDVSQRGNPNWQTVHRHRHCQVAHLVGRDRRVRNGHCGVGIASVRERFGQDGELGHIESGEPVQPWKHQSANLNDKVRVKINLSW